MHRGAERNPVVYAMSTSYLCVVLVLLLAGTFIAVKILTRRRTVRKAPAWAGGIRKLIPEMTYTATGFSNPVRVIFEAIYRPSDIDYRRETIEEHFRTAIMNGRKDIHIVDRIFLHPAGRALQSLAAILSRMHSGSINTYAAYVLLALIVVLIIQRLM